MNLGRYLPGHDEGFGQQRPPDPGVQEALAGARATVASYDPGSQRYGGAVKLEPVLGELGLGAGVDRSESQVRDSWFCEPDHRIWEPWTACGA